MQSSSFKSVLFREKLILAGLLAIVCLFTNWYFHSPLAETVSNRFLDAMILVESRFLSSQNRLAEDLGMVLVEIDQESLDRQELRWPWPRTVIADFLNRVKTVQPKVTAIDLFLTGYSENPENDQKIVEALENHGSPVVLATLFNNKNEYSTPESIFTSKKNVRGGIVNLFASPDDVVRRNFLIRQNEATGEYLPSFHLAVLLAAKYPGFYGSAVPEEPELGKLAARFPVWVPVSETREKYYASSPYLTRPLREFKNIPRVSFWQVMEDEAVLESLRNKIVIVGTTAPLLHDYHPTPFGQQSGVYIQALSLLSLLRPEIVSAYRWIPVLIFVFLAGSVLYMRLLLSRIKTFFLTLTTMVLLLAGALALLHYQGVFVDLSFPFLGTFLTMVLYLVKEDISDQLRMQKLTLKATRDPLTGVLNVASFKSGVELAMAQHVPGKGILAMIVYDIDKFKQINDTFGHEKGNQVILAFAQALTRGSRAKDLVGRFGGDEFCVMIPAPEYTEAVKFVERVNKDLAEFFKTHPEVPPFHTSAGIAVLKNPASKSYKQFYEMADAALYKAKEGGRDRFEVAIEP